MKNFIEPGEILTVIAPALVASGDLVIVGSIIGVAATDAALGAEVAVAVEGVFALPKVVTDVIAVGDKLYWATATSNLTITPGTGSKPLAGLATAAAGNGVTTVACRLMPTGITGPA